MKTNAYFENIEYQIIRRLRNAQESVKVCVAWINAEIYDPIFRELDARGVKVEVLFNQDASNNLYGISTVSPYDVYPIQTRVKSALMHNKFCIIDYETIITGSYNWSQNAPGNFEGIVVIERDYQLVKAHLQEFDDLVEYSIAFNQHKIGQCFERGCRSHSFVLGTIGPEEGKYEDTQVDLWKVCRLHHHAERIGTFNEQYLFTQLGLKDRPDFHDGDDMTKESMLAEYQSERDAINRFSHFFTQRFGIEVHAIGRPGYANETEMIKFGAAPEPCVNIIWKDTYYRKIVPDQLFETGSEGIDKILWEYSI